MEGEERLEALGNGGAGAPLDLHGRIDHEVLEPGWGAREQEPPHHRCRLRRVRQRRDVATDRALDLRGGVGEDVVTTTASRRSRECLRGDAAPLGQHVHAPLSRCEHAWHQVVVPRVGLRIVGVVIVDEVRDGDVALIERKVGDGVGEERGRLREGVLLLPLDGLPRGAGCVEVLEELCQASGIQGKVNSGAERQRVHGHAT